MSDKNKKTYRLYAMPLTAKSIEAASRERFSRATPTPDPGYVLIYSADKKPTEATEITRERENLLSGSDVRWLADCGAAILAESLAREPEHLQVLSRKVENLEKELKKRKAEYDKERGMSQNA